VIYSGTGAGDLSDLADTVKRTVDTLKPFKDRFDFIAVSGMSGALVGAPAALRLNRPLVIVRKNSDDHHGGRGEVINRQAVKGSYVFLDDFISSGTTQRYVIDKLSEHDADGGVEHVGDLLYNGGTGKQYHDPELRWKRGKGE